MPTSKSGSESHRRGLPKDIAQIKHGSVATASELRDFVGQMRGRSPQQVLGAVAQSSLVQSVMLATVVTVVLMAVMTFGPYAWGKARPKQPAPAATASANQPSANQPSANQPSANQPSSTQASSTQPLSGQPAGETAKTAERPTDPSQLDTKTLKRLGVEEAAPADPLSNPLESKGDDLLNDLK